MGDQFILKMDLRRILQWLLSQKLTEQDVTWLAKQQNRRIIWSDYKPWPSYSWSDSYADYNDEMACRIQDILDAKKEREQVDYRWAGGLPRSYVVELAQMLPIEDLSQNKVALINKILKLIP